MKRLVSKLSLAAVPVLALALAGPAAAQASHTYVSGVGDDANPCSRTAPCKTFAGAISKTAPGGEITVIDPGGFGAVTITKAITLNAEWKGEGGILITGTPGITINAGAGDIVTIRGLYIEGLGTCTSGVRVLNAAEVNLQDMVIKDCRNSGAGVGAGVDIEPTAGPVAVSIVNSAITDNGSVAGGGAGVLVKATSSGRVTLTVDGTTLTGNVVGVKVDGSASTTVTKANIRRSTISNSLQQGLLLLGIPAVATPVATMVVDDSLSTNNASAGLRADGLSALAVVNHSSFTNNNGPGLVTANNAVIDTYVNNHSVGNTSADSTLTPVGPK